MKKYSELKIQIPESDQEIWIAQCNELGAESFVQEENILLIYVEQSSTVLDDIKQLFSENRIPYQWQDIEQQDWNAAWEKSFDAITVPPLLYVRATFHDPNPSLPYELVISPKMAFGTGHHATTFMILSWMCGIDFKDKSVLDFGCGTGILGMFAQKLGAKEVIYIDNDPLSTENTLENIRQNKLEATQIILGDAKHIPPKKFHVILANITRNIIHESLPTLSQCALSDSLIACSGFLVEDEGDMKIELEHYGFAIEEINKRGEWCCIVAKKNN